MLYSLLQCYSRPGPRYYFGWEINKLVKFWHYRLQTGMSEVPCYYNAIWMFVFQPVASASLALACGGMQTVLRNTTVNSLDIQNSLHFTVMNSKSGEQKAKQCLWRCTTSYTHNYKYHHLYPYQSPLFSPLSKQSGLLYHAQHKGCSVSDRFQ